MLIGVPCVGKTTWVENSHFEKDVIYVSSDFYIEKFAKRLGKTYNDVFELVIKRAIRLMNRTAQRTIRNGKSVVWDQTSITKKSRKPKIALFDDYYKVAVMFQTPDDNTLQQRLANRKGKSIPAHVMTQMRNNLELPSHEEGFDEIRTIYQVDTH